MFRYCFFLLHFFQEEHSPLTAGQRSLFRTTSGLKISGLDRCCCDLFKVKVDGAIKELRLLQSLLDECSFDLDLKLSFCDRMDGIIISGILYTPGLAVPALIDLHESFLYTSFSNGTTRQYVIYILRQKTISSVQHSLENFSSDYEYEIRQCETHAVCLRHPRIDATKS
jgi:hypothetical protein